MFPARTATELDMELLAVDVIVAARTKTKARPKTEWKHNTQKCRSLYPQGYVS